MRWHTIAAFVFFIVFMMQWLKPLWMSDKEFEAKIAEEKAKREKMSHWQKYWPVYLLCGFFGWILLLLLFVFAVTKLY